MKNGARRLVAVGACLVLLAVVGADGRCTQRSSGSLLLSTPGCRYPCSLHRALVAPWAMEQQTEGGDHGTPAVRQAHIILTYSRSHALTACLPRAQTVAGLKLHRTPQLLWS